MQGKQYVALFFFEDDQEDSELIGPLKEKWTSMSNGDETYLRVNLEFILD